MDDDDDDSEPAHSEQGETTSDTDEKHRSMEKV